MAITAQLEAATLSANQHILLTPATSTELQEALAEDRATDMTTNQARRAAIFAAYLALVQWQFGQARRGLLPTFHEAGYSATVRSLFTRFRSYEGWWEGTKPRFRPEFVEWVEEQRSKAA